MLSKVGTVRGSASSSASHFKVSAPPKSDGTLGPSWHSFRPTALTDTLRTNLAVLRQRTYLDPKRFYKKYDGDTTSKAMVQVGTVIEGTGEYFSNRLSRRYRRDNITEEIMADDASVGYVKGRYGNLQRAKYTAGRRGNKRMGA